MCFYEDSMHVCMNICVCVYVRVIVGDVCMFMCILIDICVYVCVCAWVCACLILHENKCEMLRSFIKTLVFMQTWMCTHSHIPSSSGQGWTSLTWAPLTWAGPRWPEPARGLFKNNGLLSAIYIIHSVLIVTYRVIWEVKKLLCDKRSIIDRWKS